MSGPLSHGRAAIVCHEDMGSDPCGKPVVGVAWHEGEEYPVCVEHLPGLDREPEPPHVQEARAVIRAWELRNGHDSYVDCLGGGHVGYQAACWDCDWRGVAHLRGEEEMGTPESRAHKANARDEANSHRKDTTP